MDFVIVDDPAVPRTPEEQREIDAFCERFWWRWHYPRIVEPPVRRFHVEQAARYDVGGCE